MDSTKTVDAHEVAKFEAMAAEWWDTEGKFKPLHMLNPCRLDYIVSQIAIEFGRDITQKLPFKGLRVLSKFDGMKISLPTSKNSGSISGLARANSLAVPAFPVYHFAISANFSSGSRTVWA